MKFIEVFITVLCPILSLSNGVVDYSRGEVNGQYPVDTVATFSCNPGYSRSGYNSSTCLTPGNWNQQTPICSESNTNYPSL